MTDTASPIISAKNADQRPSPPPHPLDATWFVSIQDKTHGPYSGRAIKRFIQEGRILETTLVVAEGDTKWLKAINDPVLSDCFERRPAAAVSNNNDVSATGRGTVVQVTNNIVQPTRSSRAHEEKSPVVALLLSVLILGLGQCYNGQYGKGALMFFLGVFLWIFLLGWIVWIWSMIDAYHSAAKLNDE